MPRKGVPDLMRKPTTLFIALALAILPLAACNTVPEELAVAQQFQENMISRIQENHAIVVHAYDTELRQAYWKHLDSVFNYEVAKITDENGMLPAATVMQLQKFKDDQWQKLSAQLDLKRDEFLNDDNLVQLQRVNATVGRWIEMTVDIAARVREIVDTGRALIEGPKPTNETAPAAPAN